MTKKILTIVTFAFAIFILSQLSPGNTEAVNTCPTIGGSQLLQCSGSGTCVTSLDMCPRVPTAGGGPTPTGFGGGVKCSGALLTTPRGTSSTAAEDCADLAESQGRALGYDITCRVDEYLQTQSVPYSPSTQVTLEAAGYTGIHTDPNDPTRIIVPTLDRQPRCTINGLGIFDARSLVGYSDSTSGYVVPDTISGSVRTYGSGYTLNPGWATVPCALADEKAGKAGSLVGAATCAGGVPP